MIEVYYAAPSMYGRKVLTVLLEKNLDFSIKPLSFADGDHKKPEYLKINPNGQIPAIIDDNQIIYESTAICEYLDEEYPFPALMPQGSYPRARVRMIEDYCDQFLYPAVIKCFFKLVLRKETLTDEDKKAVDAALKRIEEYLGADNYLGGEFSLADCAIMPIIASVDALGLGEYLKRGGHFNAYVSLLRTRPSFKGASLVGTELV